MKEFRAYMSDKALKTIRNIIKSEDLTVKVNVKETALGDTVIVVYGDKEEINVLASIYKMVSR